MVEYKRLNKIKICLISNKSSFFTKSMDFLKSNKIIVLLAILAITSFVLEKLGIIHP